MQKAFREISDLTLKSDSVGDGEYITWAKINRTFFGRLIGWHNTFTNAGTVPAFFYPQFLFADMCYTLKKWREHLAAKSVCVQHNGREIEIHLGQCYRVGGIIYRTKAMTTPDQPNRSDQIVFTCDIMNPTDAAYFLNYTTPEQLYTGTFPVCGTVLAEAASSL